MEISPLALRIRVAEAISEIRRMANGGPPATGMTQEEFARRAGLKRIDVTRIEGPIQAYDRPLEPHKVRKILLAYDLGEDHPEHKRIMGMTWGAVEQGWWDSREFSGMGLIQRMLADAAHGALEVCEFQPYLVGGFAQTPDYARVRAGNAGDGGSSVDAVVRGRIERQNRLTAKYSLVIEEAVLCRDTADPDDPRIMDAQRRHLLKRSSEGAEIGVLPVDAKIARGHSPMGPIVLFRYPDGRVPEGADEPEPEIVLIDTVHKSEWIIEPEAIRMHWELFNRLRDAALPDAGSRTRIEEAIAHGGRRF